MADSNEISNEPIERKNELLKRIMNVEFYPAIIDEQNIPATLKKLPLSRIPALGVAFEPLAAAFQTIVSGGGATSGLYRVTVPAGGQRTDQRRSDPGYPA